jgi:hypothetical protein
MSTAMKSALEVAGIKVTLIKRIWLWLHDHPGRTMAEIAAALNEEKMDVSSRLNELENRQMVSFVRDHVRSGNGTFLMKRFTALGKEYELLPMQKKYKAKPPAKKFADVPTPLPLPPQAIEKKPATLPTKDWMDRYTLGELRAMYADLKRLFGE